MSSDMAAPGVTHRAGAVLGFLFGRRTWLSAGHLVLAPWWALLTAFTAVAGLAASLVTLPLLLLGVPVFVITGDLLITAARTEATWLRRLFGVDIRISPRTAPSGASMLGDARTLLTDSGFWQLVAYNVVRLPLAWLTLVVPLFSIGFGYLLVHESLRMMFTENPRPELAFLVTADQIRINGPLCLVLGSTLVLAAPVLWRAFSKVHIGLAQLLLRGSKVHELTERVGELEVSRAATVDSVEAERRRIERDLHDGAQQRLVSLAMTLGRARSKKDNDPDGASELLEQAHNEAKEAITELRDLVRGLHPPVLADRGLDAALSGLAARSPVPVTVRYDVPDRPPKTIEAIAYFMVAEALTNIARHADASRVTVGVERSGVVLRITVRDNGSGGAVVRPGHGLAGLADRASGVDGTLAVDSPNGGPTTLTMELPCES
ncbi:sensor histidine kinase [Allokutzneria sp. A3M-2-11 16]|uniref:sensor histidine kinase n=1 Tax=Allokutzneria sp. A3M-2-11 16 TaxID=2962043 RepID=UPI0020B778BC|nr:sensor histidine kinase [Allokutzneria sp. A3M-2-11 16]MCP3799794.1 sensor histidine kinase [Allokutzneria sp. A3M-2-11 16]